MSSLVVKNISTQPIWLRDLYTSLDPGQSKTCNRTSTELGDMRGLQKFIDQGLVEVTILLDQYEVSSELIAVWPLGLNWRPTVASLVALNALPATNNRLGDTRLVTSSLELYVWNGTLWVNIVVATVDAIANVYGSYSDSTDQPIPAVTDVSISYDTVEMQHGVVLTNNLLGRPTRLTVPVDGVYAFNISPQILHSGGGIETVYFWARVNEVNVPRSASSLELGNNNNRALPFIQLDMAMNAGQYLEWLFTASVGTDITLKQFPAAGVIPAIPSVIVNVKRVGALTPP